jgi:hypothetical protein
LFVESPYWVRSRQRLPLHPGKEYQMKEKEARQADSRHVDNQKVWGTCQCWRRDDGCEYRFNGW